MVWHHKGLPPPKKLKTQLLAGKIMASVLWESGLVNVYFLSHDVTVSSLLCNDVHQVIQRKRPGKLSKIILLHDSTHPHIKNLTEVTVATIGWEIMKHPPCSSDLAPSDFCLGQ
jgi:histone-lysine N-methyltransferase SETMAR